MRKLRILAIASAISIMSTMTSMAGWEQVGTQWKYQNADGSYAVGWQWLDGNGDNIAECYYLGIDGVMAVNTVVDGYTVNVDGAWVVNGVVQTKVASESGGQTSNNNSVGHQNQSGIPSLDDITGGTSSNMDNSDVQAGDSTGLPPMQAGTGNNRRVFNSGNVGGLDWTAECGDSTGLPPME